MTIPRRAVLKTLALACFPLLALASGCGSSSTTSTAASTSTSAGTSPSATTTTPASTSSSRTATTTATEKTPKTTTPSGRLAPPCVASQLTGSFALVPNSNAAGSVIYALTLRNRSAGACGLSGLSDLRLLDASGVALPTAATVGAAGGIVTLRGGGSATAQARFSPDVAGSGEPTTGPCERPAAGLRMLVAPDASRLTVPVSPSTAVCEHGQMSFGLLSH